MLDLVTVTGADDTFPPGMVIQFAHQYPHAEFGLLMSYKSEDGLPRFPSNSWLRRLTELKVETPELQLAAHLCGPIVQDVFDGKLGHVFARLWTSNRPRQHPFFKRLQLNTHGVQIRFDPATLRSSIDELLDLGYSVIFQFDGVNTEALDACVPLNEAFPRGERSVSTLFDRSHGEEVLPTSWPAIIPEIRCGYAGGLSPENVASQLAILSQIVPANKSYWIDAETHLRSPLFRSNIDLFDAVKVSAFLEAAAPFVTSPRKDQP